MAVFSGECSWAPGQLEEELARGVWLLVRSPAALAAMTSPQGAQVQDVWAATMQVLLNIKCKNFCLAPAEGGNVCIDSLAGDNKRKNDTNGSSDPQNQLVTMHI